MEAAVQWFVAITSLVMGASHILRARDWVDLYRRLHALGRPGAFINGGITILPAAAIVAAHRVWTGPAAVLTIFGWLMLLKAAVCFLAPDAGLRSMKLGTTPARYIAAGTAQMALGLWACYCVWITAAKA